MGAVMEGFVRKTQLFCFVFSAVISADFFSSSFEDPEK